MCIPRTRVCIYKILLRIICFLSLPDIPTCIDHSFDPNNPEMDTLLMFGDEAGGLTIVHFLQPLNSLFDKDEVNNVQCLFWPDVVGSAASDGSGYGWLLTGI